MTKSIKKSVLSQALFCVAITQVLFIAARVVI
jgi:hypothetical protein